MLALCQRPYQHSATFQEPPLPPNSLCFNRALHLSFPPLCLLKIELIFLQPLSFCSGSDVASFSTNCIFFSFRYFFGSMKYSCFKKCVEVGGGRKMVMAWVFF